MTKNAVIVEYNIKSMRSFFIKLVCTGKSKPTFKRCFKCKQKHRYYIKVVILETHYNIQDSYFS